ncbi:hypothetical protein NEQG_01894 [Nematocida parisii ERTm3]|uniref:Uncharacterized protein n=1 Tax=Nematocida parisii (strain ERTm3) TaxID=935791 RepID=I3EF25_NEMP3|nr:hypothetical protein NEQG_01894 [Nematocida parisii ERTm3]
MFTLMRSAQSGIFDELSTPQGNKQNLVLCGVNTPHSLKQIHVQWAVKLIKELQIFTLQETYAEFKEKEDKVQANPAWHVSSPREKLIYFQKSISERKEKDYAPIIPKITLLLQAIDMYQAESTTEVSWDDIVLPKLIDILDQHNLAKIWQIPFCFDFHDMRSWAIAVSYDILKKRIPWRAVVKLVRKKEIHKVFTEDLDESVENTDLLISLSTEIDLNRLTKESGQSQKTSIKYLAFCTFCNKKGHIVEVCNSLQKHKRQKSTEYTLANYQFIGGGGRPLKNPSFIYKEIVFSGHSITGRHSTGSDVNLLSWQMYNKIAIKTGAVKIKPHNYVIKDGVGGRIPSTSYMEGSVHYKKKCVGVHRFFIINTDDEAEADNIFGLSLLQALTKVDGLTVENISECELLSGSASGSGRSVR